MTNIRIYENPDGAFTVRIWGGDRQTFLNVVEDLKDRIPSHNRKWIPGEKIWVIDDRYYLDDWADEIKEWDGVKVLWEVPMRPDNAFSALHLLPTAPPELVRAAYKILALIHHPDRGGDAEMMKSVNAAYDVLKKER